VSAGRPFVVSATKDPVFVESGRRGAEKRWADPAKRVAVRIDDLTLEQRSLVLALIEAAKKAAPNANGTASKESRRATVADHPAAA
jgi:hypothetical protein